MLTKIIKIKIEIFRWFDFKILYFSLRNNLQDLPTAMLAFNKVYKSTFIKPY